MVIDLPIISIAMVPNIVMSGYESMQGLYVHKEQQRAKHRPLWHSYAKPHSVLDLAPLTLTHRVQSAR